MRKTNNKRNFQGRLIKRRQSEGVFKSKSNALSHFHDTCNKCKKFGLLGILYMSQIEIRWKINVKTLC